MLAPDCVIDEHKQARGVTRQRACPLQRHGPQDAMRGEVERFIQGIYRHRHGAEVHLFAPTLISLRDADGELVAAAGYRAASHAGRPQALFLERYLAKPVETCLADGSTVQPLRSRIVEVGHLAACRAGEGRRLILALAPHLAQQGFQWVVGTLTQELRHLFVRLGIVPMALGAADPSVLGAAAAHWGRYYEHRPVVLAGRLDLALQAMGRRGPGA